MNDLDDLEAVKRMDIFDMSNKLEETPKNVLTTLEQAASSGLKSFSSREYRSIIIGGLGGSAIVGDVINDWLRDTIEIPISINRGYSLPAFANKNTLFIAVSYSGNTIETLVQLKKALEKKCAVYAVTSGGELETECVSSKIPYLKVPTGTPPRVALPYLLASTAYIMYLEGFISDLSDLKNASKRMLNLVERIRLETPTELNICKRLAISLNGKLPLIFGLERFASVARRLKCQFNENCKIQAKYEIAPELCHNEIESFRHASLNPHSMKIAILMLRSEIERKMENIMLEALKETLDKSGIKELYEIWGEGNVLESILTSVYLIDYLTYYLAILRGVDPTPVKSIEAFKMTLKKRT